MVRICVFISLLYLLQYIFFYGTVCTCPSPSHPVLKPLVHWSLRTLLLMTALVKCASVSVCVHVPHARWFGAQSRRRCPQGQG